VNAKKIENKISANIIKEVNDEALKTLLREYEEKLSKMEKEKRIDEYHSNKLMIIIQQLEKQKQALAERLISAKVSGSHKKKILSLKEEQVGLRYTEEFVPGVGVCKKIKLKKEREVEKCEYDFEGKFALLALKNMKQQKNLTEAKLAKIDARFDEFAQEKASMMRKIAS
jgi:hypothetical protein